MRRWTYRQSDDRGFTVEETDSSLAAQFRFVGTCNTRNIKAGTFVRSSWFLPGNGNVGRQECAHVCSNSAHMAAQAHTVHSTSSANLTLQYGKNVTGDCQNETLHAGSNTQSELRNFSHLDISMATL
jgi:hypothetical protein